jgi:hypothetical protein
MRRALAAAALLYSALHFAMTGLRQPLSNFYGDFLASFPAWRVASLAGRLDLYNGSLAQKWGPPPIWHYGPVEHLITLPLLAFPTLRQAYVAWFFVSLAFVIITALIAMRLIGEALVVVLVFCNFNPLYEALTQRNIELFELMLLFGAYALYRRGRDSACGIAIGTAAMAKFLPLIYLPWLVLKRRWRALAAALAVIVPIAIATQFILGWQNSGILLQLAEGSYIRAEANQSLSGVVTRLVTWTHADLSVPAVSRVLIIAGLVALSALMLRLRRREGIEDLEFGLLAVAMVLLPPHNQHYYFVFLLLPYLLLYARYRGEWSWRATLLALSFLLVAVPIPLSVVQRLTGIAAFRLYLRAGIPFVGAALLVIVLVAEIGMAHAVLTAEQPCPSKKPSQTSALS